MRNFIDMSETANDDSYWLALQDKQSYFPTSIIADFYDDNRSIKPLFDLSYYDLIDLGLTKISAKRFSKFRNNLDFYEITKVYNSFKKEKIKLIKYIDNSFPSILKQIKNPPLMLFQKGNFSLNSNFIAISGTRNPSLYGRLMSRKIAYELTKSGYTIISGLAHGVDEWAHIGALEAPNGKTVAVLAWLSPDYPSEHSELIKDVIKKGAVVSEVIIKPESREARGKFIQRNRLISGLSQAVVAIESDGSGGTVRQVELAIKQDKLVFALEPKSSERSKRGFKVFKEMGAIPVKNAKEILKTLRSKYGQSTLFSEPIHQKKLGERN